MRFKDSVTNHPGLAQAVINRDIQEWMRRIPLFETRRGAIHSIHGCVAVFLAPSTSGPCWGRLTLDHVKSEPRMSKRAENDSDHLVTLCQGHMEDGMRAGYQWNTANRQLLRWYLRSLNETET